MSRPVHYRVIRKLARGGMAEIFLALQIGAEGFQKPVVLKRILPALAADPAFVRMLVDEAHIASILNHSNLVQVLDLGKSGDQFFLVLEFVDGWSLEQVRRRAQKARLKLPLPLVLYIVSALCRGLAYVHKRSREGRALGIVHRDVTPQNVLLSREGEVKLADFGIAKAMGRREKSSTGVIKGKFAYMSPEQSVGGELDARSDLFSVGTVLYVLTTGRKPFDGATDLDVLMQVRKARYEKPSELVRDFNPDVERFIARALRADLSRRWQSADQMADRLDAILVKLAQPSGSATLKRWLDTLTVRDGVVPPGDLDEAAAEEPTGTIELGSRDLELQDVSPPVEPAAAPAPAPAPVPRIEELRPAEPFAVSPPAVATSPPAIEVSSAAVEVSSAAIDLSSPAVEVSRSAVEVSPPTIEVSSSAIEVASPAEASSPGAARLNGVAGNHEPVAGTPVAPAPADVAPVSPEPGIPDGIGPASAGGTAAAGSDAYDVFVARPSQVNFSLASGASRLAPSSAASPVAAEEVSTRRETIRARTRRAASEGAPLAGQPMAADMAYVPLPAQVDGLGPGEVLFPEPTPSVSLQPPSGPRGARIVRWLARATVAAVLSFSLLGSGAYFARPYLPMWLAQPVGVWLDRLPSLLDLDEPPPPLPAPGRSVP